jgi:hypothetical protein
MMAGLEPGTTEAGMSFFTSDDSQKYLGDPVEHSFASLYVGLGFYMVGDLQNALVAFKKSLEWDYNTDPELQGNMVITNHMMGECYTLLGESDDAVVGYRRALKENPDFVPAYVGVIRELEKMNNLDEAARFRGELADRVPGVFVERIKEHSQGILTVIMSGSPPKVKEAGEAFRQREEEKYAVHAWMLTAGEVYSRVPTDHARDFNPDSTLQASIADRSIDHFKSQGGEVGQATRKAIKSVISAVTTELLGFGAETGADLRYWSTIPGRVYGMYLPVEPGVHSLYAYAFDNDYHRSEGFDQRCHYIPVKENRTTTLVLISLENLIDPGKPVKAAPATACCDATGHNPDNIPFILEGSCFCTPTRKLVDKMHAAGFHPDTDYRSLKDMYDQAGIVTCHDHRGCNNLCEKGPHVAFGGKCMASPTPGTRNYEKVLSWKPIEADSIQTSQLTEEGDK